MDEWVTHYLSMVTVNLIHELYEVAIRTINFYSDIMFPRNEPRL